MTSILAPSRRTRRSPFAAALRLACSFRQRASAPTPTLAPFGAVGAAPQAPWQVVGLPQQTKPFTRFSVVDIDGKRAVKIEADESYGNLVHPVQSRGRPAHLAWQWRIEKPLETADLREKQRRRHRGQGLRLLRPADRQHPVHRSPAAAPGARQDERPGADGDGLLRLGREAAGRNDARQRLHAAHALHRARVGQRPARPLGRREARRRRRLHASCSATRARQSCRRSSASPSAPIPTTPRATAVSYVSGLVLEP